MLEKETPIDDLINRVSKSIHGNKHHEICYVLSTILFKIIKSQGRSKQDFIELIGKMWDKDDEYEVW